MSEGALKSEALAVLSGWPLRQGKPSWHKKTAEVGGRPIGGVGGRILRPKPYDRRSSDDLVGLRTVYPAVGSG
jgi:hypothetical protein